MGKTHHFDVLILGSGAAGLGTALKLAPHCKVAVLSKAALSAGSTNLAQGGIAAVLEEGDSIESHIEDTLIAGAGLCRRETVEFVVGNARAVVEELIELGVEFSRDLGEQGAPYHLSREGGHSHRRVIHVDDATGAAVQQRLERAARAHPNIKLLENHIAVDLITQRHVGGEPGCHGAYILDRGSQRVERFLARATVLATGGASKVYLYTSNPDGSTGDGIAMAWRAGCRVANMEFNQFHPTCLYHPEAKSFLVTEAMRGEGALLKLPNGERFMDEFHPLAELAPRDVVARAIDHEMKRLGLDHVLLDISHRDPDFVIGHFPTIYRRCIELGFDITKAPIPVVPAAHYSCGGIMIDAHARTDLAGLYAVGECAHSGLHGANRMASNSLLECLVFGHAAAAHILGAIDRRPQVASAPPWDESRVTSSDEEIVVTHNWHELRQFMWDYVGIVRTDKRLERAKRRVELLRQEITDYYRNFRVTRDLLELRNLSLVAELIIRSAMARKESRGLHYNLDYPDLLAEAEDTILSP